tara:strand:+ start:2056 stop:2304 length:249 start_codon:yes stop_codon:yes gene_type:complete
MGSNTLIKELERLQLALLNNLSNSELLDRYEPYHLDGNIPNRKKMIKTLTKKQNKINKRLLPEQLHDSISTIKQVVDNVYNK